MIKLKDIAIAKIVKDLSDSGRDIVRKAYETATYDKNKTQNLHDSYGSAVYVDGRLIESSKFFLTSRAAHGVYNSEKEELQYGRNEIEYFFKTYKPVSKGFELVTAAAIFYAEILTEASGGQRKKYRVIANALGDLNTVSQRYKGSTVHTINRGQRND